MSNLQQADTTSPTVTHRKLDNFIGSQLRQARRHIGWNQARLAEVLGVTFQQVQKYETGRNRISASTLYVAAKALGFNIGYFYG